MRVRVEVNVAVCAREVLFSLRWIGSVGTSTRGDGRNHLYPGVHESL